MKKFLTAKHWQLFVLLIGLPVICQFILMGVMFSSLSGLSSRETMPDMRPFFTIFPIMMTLVIVVFFGWFYSLGTNLFKMLPDTVRMSLTRFKVFLFIPVIYIVFICVFMFGFAPTMFVLGQSDPRIVLLIIPIHIFSMFCMFYCLYFNAKVLKTVELQKPVTFSDYAGEFFLLWFFPVGVWIIQPRINRLFDATPA
jgi:hypothetical protein